MGLEVINSARMNIYAQQSLPMQHKLSVHTWVGVHPPIEPYPNPFPFHRLIPELLIKIFKEAEFACRLNSGSSGYTLPFPVLASHVCRLWREVALDAAVLWNEVRIREVRLPRHRFRARCFIQRSKFGPLDVKYYAPGTSKLTFDALSKILLNDLTPVISRVRHLTIFAESESVLNPALSLLGNLTAPSLESLRLSLVDPYSKQDENRDILPINFTLFAGGTPSLRHVQLNSIPHFPKSSIGMLSSLSFRMKDLSSSIELPAFADMLEAVSKTLAKLAIFDVCFAFPNNLQTPIAPINLPMLKILQLSKITNLPFPNTPILENMNLDIVDDAIVTEFCKLCTTSTYATLRSLTFSCIKLARFKDDATWLRSLPLLTELVLWECYDEPAILRHLEEATPKEEGGNDQAAAFEADGTVALPLDTLRQSLPTESLILPNLRSLTTTTQEGWPVVQRILENRIRNGRAITSFRSVHFGGNEMEEWLAKRNIQFEELWCDDLESRLDWYECEWWKEEEDFEELLEEDEEHYDWSEQDVSREYGEED